MSSLGPAAASLGALAPLWGWLDQKNEAIAILSKFVAGSRRRLPRAGNRERRELVAAAHSAIVVGAYFEILRANLGGERFAALELSDRDKANLATSRTYGQPLDVMHYLYDSEIPSPSATRGFEENVKLVEAWYRDLANRTQTFLAGLQAWAVRDNGLLDRAIPEAVEKYREYYIGLAQQVPEFYLVAQFGEHAATRVKMETAQEEIQAALRLQREDLRRVHDLLAITAPRGDATSDPVEALTLANQARLIQPIIREYESGHLEDVSLPQVGEAFVAPAFKVVPYGSDSRIF